jgi:hypothetical protein
MVGWTLRSAFPLRPTATTPGRAFRSQYSTEKARIADAMMQLEAVLRTDRPPYHLERGRDLYAGGRRPAGFILRRIIHPLHML